MSTFSHPHPGEGNERTRKSILANWTSGTFSLKLIFFGAFVVMASKCSLVRICSLQKERIKDKGEMLKRACPEPCPEFISGSIQGSA
jgi:hypothetical protein